jgi:aminoglycoside phosphotransferase (APT) family kinase protein
VTVAGSRRDVEAVRSGLRAWLAASRPDADDVRVGPLRQPTSGFSSETLLVDVVWTESGRDREERVVARLPPAGEGIFPTYDLAAQARVQAALASAGIPVAAPIAVELDESWLGCPFLVMEHVAGTIVGDAYVAAGALRDAAPAEQARVQRGFVEVLADVHRLDWDRLGLGDLTDASVRGLTHEVERAEEYAAWATDGEVPSVLGDALAWCRARRPPREPALSLVWGDPRLGNVVYDATWRPRALLDWEMASIAPAELDLFWFLALHEVGCGAAGADLPGFGSRDEIVGVYERRLGRSVAAPVWFEVLSLVRSDSIFCRIRRLLLAAGVDKPWLTGPTPGQRTIAALLARDPG